MDVVVSGKYAQVNYWGRIYKKDRQRALDFMELLGCRYLEGKTWMTFSQGEKQRLLIARAMMAKLEVLILDEPCAGLDPVAREHFLNTIQQLAVKTTRTTDHSGDPPCRRNHTRFHPRSRIKRWKSRCSRFNKEDAHF